MRLRFPCAAGVWLLSFVHAGEPPHALLCPGRASQPAFQCGERSIPRSRSTRFILIHTNLRESDGLEQYLTGLGWPLNFGNVSVPAQRGDYLIAAWQEAGEDRAAVYPVEANARVALGARITADGYSLLDLGKARQELRRRIATAHPGDHARKFLGPFGLANFHLRGGTYEFTVLENPDGVDVLCVEDQALIAPRRWWLVPVHIIPTDDKRSQGFIAWSPVSGETGERKVEEVRFAFRKVRVLDE